MKPRRSLDRSDRQAVQNFLASLGDLTAQEAFANARMDAQVYRWNADTRNAIAAGITAHFRPGRTELEPVAPNGWRHVRADGQVVTITVPGRD